MEDPESTTTGPTSQRLKSLDALGPNLVKAEIHGTQPAGKPKVERLRVNPRNRPQNDGNTTLAGSSKSNGLGNMFACPFLKYDPSSHARCSSLSLRRMSSVKQHLRRRHFQPFFCFRCHEVFKDEDSALKHIRECRHESETLGQPPFVGRDQMDRVRAVSLRRMSAEKAWLEFYQILFPGRPPPFSPYLENTLDLELAKNRQFCVPSEPQILRHVLSRFDPDGDGVSLATAPQDIRPAILSIAMDEILKRWGHQSSGRSMLGSSGDSAASGAALAPAGTPSPADLPGLFGGPGHETTWWSGENLKIASGGLHPVSTTTGPSSSASDGAGTISQDSDSQASFDGSEVSDHPWFDDVGLSGVSRFLAVEEAAVSRLMDAYSAWSRSITTAPPADAPESSPPGRIPSASNQALPPQSQMSSSTPRTPHGAPKKGGKRGRDDDEPSKPPAQKRQRVEDGELLLACPFQKRYHPKNLFCGESQTIRGFRTIARVKEHIGRCHMLPLLYCSRCKTVFEHLQEHEEHVEHYKIPGICEERSFPDVTMLPRSKGLTDAFKKRVDPKLSLDEQWFSVWRILFPGADQPASCRVDDILCGHVTALQRFVSTEGENLVTEVLRTEGVLPEAQGSAGTPEGIIIISLEELEGICQRVFNRASEMIFDRWPCPRGQQAGRCNESRPIESAKGKGREAASTSTLIPAKPPAIPAGGVRDEATPGASSTIVPAEATLPAVAAGMRHGAAPGDSSMRDGDGSLVQDDQSLLLRDDWLGNLDQGAGTGQDMLADLDFGLMLGGIDSVSQIDPAFCISR